MVDISRETHQKNDIEKIVDNDGILWFDEKHIEEGLGHKNLREITIKYHSDHRKHRYELVEEPKKQCNRIFIDEKLAIKEIMDCRKTPAHKFRTRLKNGHNDKNIDYKIKIKKQQNKNFVVSLLELILKKNTLIFLELTMKYLDSLNNQLKKL